MSLRLKGHVTLAPRAQVSRWVDRAYARRLAEQELRGNGEVLGAFEGDTYLVIETYTRRLQEVVSVTDSAALEWSINPAHTAGRPHKTPHVKLAVPAFTLDLTVRISEGRDGKTLVTQVYPGRLIIPPHQWQKATTATTNDTRVRRNFWYRHAYQLAP